MEIIVKFVLKISSIKSKSILLLTGIYLLFNVNFAMAGEGGTDLLADPTKDLFKTFVGTGINLLLLAEVLYGIYLFNTSRKLAVFIGLPVVLGITAWAKAKFG